MFGRKPAMTHTQMMRNELAESYDHFRQAASHVAGGAAERLAPRYEQARGMANRRVTTARGAVNPLMQQMKEGATNARVALDVRPQKKKKQRKRWPALVGLLAAGTAVGATGAMIMRRRRAAAEWEEQEAIPPIEYGEQTRPDTRQKAAEKVAAGATSMAESVSAKASKVADSAREGVSESGRAESGRSGSTGTRPSGTSGTTSSGTTSSGTTSSGTRSTGPTPATGGGVGATESPGPVGGSPLRDLGENSTGSATGQRNSGARGGSGGSSPGNTTS